ncbi:regulatory protein [Pseudoclavibacter chungangensis]|uniref:regulatory protein RecX n=1 Tax=Pseudoclavibacter chungangensis TaxID=587635 RepID=UPI0015CE1D56|nr:regulatory protein RecX [Pseudoclavibacter chungangensis]NYJ67013.1 regulatory protein [Pseudoclavibacter chungangensis]
MSVEGTERTGRRSRTGTDTETDTRDVDVAPPQASRARTASSGSGDGDGRPGAESVAWADPIRISFAGTTGAGSVGTNGSGSVGVAGVAGVGAELDAILAEAETDLVRALRRTDRSRAEGRAILEAHDELGAGHIEDLLDRMTELGYLDDERLAATLAERLTRKGQGPIVIGRTLRERRLDPDAIALALEALDDDDEAERAVELARARASRMRGVDSGAARRRLAAYLQRRGFDGATALRAADTALGEGARSNGSAHRGGSGVFFGNAD